MTEKTLRVLMAEDSADDAELVRRQFVKAGYAVVLERLETEAAMREALEAQSWDVVISDYSMPHFDAPSALQVLTESGLDLPFIVVSGRIGEDAAVGLMRAGAHDYVLKDDLARLIPAVERELREAEHRRHQRVTELEKERLQHERDDLLDRLKQENDELAALTAVTTNAISTLDLDELLNVLLGRLVEGMHADAGAILLAKGDELRIAASAGIVDLNDPGYVRRIGEGFSGTVAARLKPVYVEDAQEDPLISHPLMRERGIRTLIGVPLKNRGALVGVLHVHWLSVRPYNDRAVHLLEITAERCAAAVVNAQLYGEAKRTAAALVESEARFRRVVESDMMGLLFWDATGAVTDANDAFLAIMGHSREDIGSEGLNWMNMMTPENREADLQALSEIARTGVCEPYEREYFRGDGTRVPLLIGMAAFPEQPGTGVAFLLDVTERKKAEAALQESERRFRTIFEAEPECVKLLSLDGSLLEMNPAGLAMLEATSVDEVRQRGLMNFVVPDDREAWRGLLHRTLAGEIGLLEFEVEGLKGTRRWLETHSAPIWNADNRATLIMGITRDITERKRAETALKASLLEKEALLKEVHHRVKNNLQVITSLLRLENARSEHPGTKSVLREMQGRIQAMALLHESLYRSNTLATVDLGAYLGQLATQSMRAASTGPGAVELELDLASVRVEMDRAIPCGLLVNELISNCLKHGFPEGRAGKIRVTLHHSSDGRLHLKVTDNGVGLPADFAARQGKSLGVQLAGDLARQLGGRLETGPGPGAEFTATFPGPVVTDRS